MSKTLQFLLWAVLAFILIILIINFAEGLRYFAFTESSASTFGILFIVLAFGAFILEMLTPGFGLFTSIGLVSLTIGSILLFQIQPWLIIVIDAAIAVLAYFTITRVIKAQRRPVKTGREEMTGKVALVRETLNPKGLVYYDGELWTAVSETVRIEVGEMVTIKQVDGVVLHVIRQ